MKALITVGLMVTVAPFLAVLTLVCWKPDRWGGSLNPFAILAMAYFGLLNFPAMCGYLLALFTTPLVMGAVSKLRVFRSLPVVPLLTTAFLVGAVAGVAIMAPVVIGVSDSLDLMLNWAASGSVSGGVTLVLIVLVYRRNVDSKGRQEPNP